MNGTTISATVELILRRYMKNYQNQPLDSVRVRGITPHPRKKAYFTAECEYTLPGSDCPRHATVTADICGPGPEDYLWYSVRT